jgi:hypothetical protein
MPYNNQGSSAYVASREGHPKEQWSTVLVITALGSWGKNREGDPKGWFMVLVTALGSWEKPLVPHGHHLSA